MSRWSPTRICIRADAPADELHGCSDPRIRRSTEPRTHEVTSALTCRRCVASRSGSERTIHMSGSSRIRVEMFCPPATDKWRRNVGTCGRRCGRGLRRAGQGWPAAASQPWMADRAEEQTPAGTKCLSKPACRLWLWLWLWSAQRSRAKGPGLRFAPSGLRPSRAPHARRAVEVRTSSMYRSHFVEKRASSTPFSTGFDGVPHLSQAHCHRLGRASLPSSRWDWEVPGDRK